MRSAAALSPQFAATSGDRSTSCRPMPCRSLALPIRRIGRRQQKPSQFIRALAVDAARLPSAFTMFSWRALPDLTSPR
jgi:hypothetical protein